MIHLHKPIFLRFCDEFVHVLWHVKSVFLSLAGLVAIGAIIIARVEKIPLEEALYFAGITGLTIGYGDIVPKTPAGQVTALLIGLTGILFTGMITAAALRAIGQSMKNEKKREDIRSKNS
jgi:voltage-gated potassium channel